MEPAEFYRHVFDEIAPAYERLHVYQAAGERLVGFLALGRGEAVCDVAAGTGAVMLPALRAVQPGGRVAAVDLSAGMLAQAQEAVGALPGASYHLAEADRLPFPDASFDSVTCGLALPFFPDMQAALDDARRVLRPGGSIGLSLFFGEPLDPALPLFTVRLRRLLPPAASLPAANQHVAEPGRLKELLRASGFSDYYDEVDEQEVIFSDLEEWWEAAIASVPGAELARLSPAERRSFETAHRAELAPFTASGRLRCRVAIRYARATRAA
jgi:ubiquinone/menaquinone biosynthesis C-methylase UbiE